VPSEGNVQKALSETNAPSQVLYREITQKNKNNDNTNKTVKTNKDSKSETNIQISYNKHLQLSENNVTNHEQKSKINNKELSNHEMIRVVREETITSKHYTTPTPPTIIIAKVQDKINDTNVTDDRKINDKMNDDKGGSKKNEQK